MLKYWSNAFAMLGVVLIATAFFKDDWEAEIYTGTMFIFTYSR